MPTDLAGRVCVVTGATRGIGRATAAGLTKLGATVVLICRQREDGERVSREVRVKDSPLPDVVTADLSSQTSIRQAAASIRERYRQLHVLINNAGVFTRRRELTVDGLEMQFAVNHLAYFLLTNLLLEQLEAGAPSRIINVSSGAHAGARIDFGDLQGERGYDPGRAYSHTKLANLLFTYELARRLSVTGVTGVTVNALHPGVIATNLLANYMGVPVVGSALDRTFGATPEEGAETSIYLAASPAVEGITGKYFVRKKPAASSRESHDAAAARRLWEVSERLTRLSS
jgi:NAD(P)-dependent dehydrogenase (short-subunit alcohol dehydrogenase family)